jgi:hypothetical protein
MTDPDRTESSEPDPQPVTDESEPDPQPVTDEGPGEINQEDAEQKASADYQERMQEFDNVETTPVVSVPSPGEAGKVEIPKP